MRLIPVVLGLMVVCSSASAQDHAGHAGRADPLVARETGQGAFAAVQEIVRILNEDPSTAWERVDLEALRQHLRDMAELTLQAEAAETPIEGGVSVAVTGTGRTLEAIRRMVPAHAVELDRLETWTAAGVIAPGGAVLTVTSDDPGEVRRIRGLGFIGLMATGAHHQAHHLAIARGEAVHRHP